MENDGRVNERTGAKPSKLLKDHTNEKYCPGWSWAGAVNKAEVKGGLSTAVPDLHRRFKCKGKYNRYLGIMFLCCVFQG